MALPSITSSWADTFGWWVGEWAFPALPPSLSHTRLSISLCARTSMWEPHLGNWELYHEYWGTPFLLSLTPSLSLSLSLFLSIPLPHMKQPPPPASLSLTLGTQTHNPTPGSHTSHLTHSFVCVCVNVYVRVYEKDKYLFRETCQFVILDFNQFFHAWP